MGGRFVRALDTSAPKFRACLKRIHDKNLIREIREALGTLATVDLDQAPAFLKMHMLTGCQVPSAVNDRAKVAVWTIHVTRNDAYKASFTLEDGVAYMRLLDTHAQIDRNP